MYNMESSKAWDNLQFGQAQCIQRKRQKMMFTPEDDPKMWNFIAENFLIYGPFEIFTKMKESLGYEHVDKSLYYRFRNILAPNLHLTTYNVETKLQIAKKFNILLNEEFKQSLLPTMNLIFDANGYIEDFSWKNDFPWKNMMSMPTTSSEVLLSLATSSPIELKRPKRELSSLDLSNHTPKKSRRKSTESNNVMNVEDLVSGPFMDSLKEVISETVLASNRKLIEELKSSNLASSSNAMDPTASSTTPLSTKHNFLQGLKNLVNRVNTPELEDIRNRINSLEERLEEDDTSLSISSIHSFLDEGLKMIGG